MLRCTKCGSKNVVVGVTVFMYIDPDDAHKLTKKAIAKGSTQVLSASWDKAQLVCRDCNYTHIGV